MKLIKIITKIIFSIIFLIIFLATIVSSIISRSIDKSPNYLIETIYNSVKLNPYQSQTKINFLILGLDKRDDALEKTTTTDTIIFASLDLETSKLNLISTPRDLWFYEKEVKINNLYPLSLEQGQDTFGFLKSNFEKLYGQPIDHVIVISTDNLINFVNIIGGVDLYLEKGFVDDQYPNPEYIKNPTSSIPIYKTIEFPSGWIHLDSSNITEFVRSRKSAETAAQGGTDIGRIQRQQLLIDTLLNKIKSGTFINSTDQLKNFYFFWQHDISKTLSDTDVLQIGLILNKNLKNISLNKIEIPIGTNNTSGIIYHPEKTNFTKQWIFTTNDDKYQSFHQFISEKIN
ncbi:MAG: LCP family protein [Candidatus Shapirobacteria bacterium]|nr:LCP family protein [Candidatus Shapirobacteria bacterium]